MSSFPSVSSRQRLDDCRDRLQELRRRQVRARDLRDASKAAVNGTSGPIDTSSEDFRRLERATNDVRELETSISLVEQEEKFVSSQLAGLDGPLHNDSFLNDPHRLEE